MGIFVVGISHKTAPVEVRERLAFSENQLSTFWDRLKDSPALEEEVLLSTCNRVEIYAQGRETEEGVSQIKGLLSSHHRFPLEYFERYLYVHRHGEAVKHLFRVSASLDSLVMGEPQILGQVKKAYFSAREAGATGLILNQLFGKAFSVAKRVRTETQLGEHAVAEEIVEREAWHFLGWLEAQNAVPTIQSLREKAERIRMQEMEKTLSRVPISEKEREEVNAMTAAIVNKLLHGPISYIKQQAHARNGFNLEAIRQLFGLDGF